MSKAGRRDVGTLRNDEKWWRDRYNIIERHGYRLRPRYRPDWVPSWKSTGKSPNGCEDSLEKTHAITMDATRILDNKTVVLKRVQSDSKEIATFIYLTSPELLKDPDNHCVPLLERFTDDEEPGITYLVMPLLRNFASPSFITVEEVVDFVKQSLEGLRFLHSHNVAHRDCSATNIMFDATALYPEGFHPASPSLSPLADKAAPSRSRTAVGGVKYYYIDFELSTHFQESSKLRLVTGVKSAVYNIPELSEIIPYDPFAVDIFALGTVFKTELIDKYGNISFLRPLVTSMTQADPADRPKIQEALNIFTELVSKRSSISLRWKIRDNDYGPVFNFFFVDVDSARREVVHVVKIVIGSVVRTVTLRSFKKRS